jgi:L-seryl-tRNA(Ser) seleniumtransferase
MLRISQTADLVCFGGKYFGAPSSTGFVCGRADLVHATSRQGFVASQSGDRPRSFGRSMKVDRQEIVGMVVALEEWLTIDHEDRILEYLSKAAIIQDSVADLVGVSTQVQRLESHASASLTVAFDTDTVGQSGHTVADGLASGIPKILVGHGDTSITVSLHTLHEGQPEVIADRLRAILAGEIGESRKKA